MRSQRAASFMKWVEMKMVTPCSRDCSISSRQNSSRASGSTPEVGSSRISSSGLVHQRHGKREALPDAERQVGGERVAMAFEAETLGQLGDARARLVARQLEQPGVQVEVLRTVSSR